MEEEDDDHELIRRNLDDLKKTQSKIKAVLIIFKFLIKVDFLPKNLKLNSSIHNHLMNDLYP